MSRLLGDSGSPGSQVAAALVARAIDKLDSGDVQVCSLSIRLSYLSSRMTSLQLCPSDRCNQETSSWLRCSWKVSVLARDSPARLCGRVHGNILHSKGGCQVVRYEASQKRAPLTLTRWAQGVLMECDAALMRDPDNVTAFATRAEAKRALDDNKVTAYRCRSHLLAKGQAAHVLGRFLDCAGRATPARTLFTKFTGF